MPHDDVPSATGHGQKDLASADGPASVSEHSWLRNRLWLVLPVLALNAALSPQLPRTYAQEPFAAGGPAVLAGLAVAENVLRFLLCASPVLMRPAPCRRALLIYACGLSAYAGAWLAVVAAPDSSWSTSLIGFTAPAWTSLFWLAGIGWGSKLHFVPRYRPWMYGVAAVAFTTVHTVSFAAVWIRTG